MSHTVEISLGQSENSISKMSQIFTIESTGSKPAQPAKFKNRSRMEIIASILNIARTGSLKTHLMYKANLSYMVVTQYLEFLASSNLIKELFDEQGMVKLYQTTPRGLKYLEVYESLQNLTK